MMPEDLKKKAPKLNENTFRKLMNICIFSGLETSDRGRFGRWRDQKMEFRF